MFKPSVNFIKNTACSDKAISKAVDFVKEYLQSGLDSEDKKTFNLLCRGNAMWRLER